jgi:preprotein translocase subunit SecD
MNINSSSQNDAGQQSHGGSASTPPANVANSGSHGDQSTPTIEDLQKQLAAAQAKAKELIDDNAKYRAERKRQEDAATTAETERLKAQGEFQKLAEQAQIRAKELESELAKRDAEIAQRDHEALRTRIAAKHGLAPEIAERLRGANEVELESDAAALKKIVGEQRSSLPGNGPGPRPTAQTPETLQQEQIQRLRRSGRYGNL